MVLAKKCDGSSIDENETPGSLDHFRGFLFHLCKAAYTFRLLLPVVSINSFIKNNRYIFHQSKKPRGIMLLGLSCKFNIPYPTNVCFGCYSIIIASPKEKNL